MLTILWDVDDVLNDLMREWLERAWLPHHPACAATYRDLSGNPPCHALGADMGEYLGSLDDFRAAHFASLAPLPEAARWFAQHGERYRHIALTAVPLRGAAVSAGWVIGNFGRWIRTYHFVPSERTGEPIPRYDRSKKDFLAGVQGDSVLVDDREENVEAARSLGMRAWLMPRPWNSAGGEIADVFEELSQLR